MFFCKNCSKLLDEDLKTCPYCGSVEDESAADLSSPDTQDYSLDETINKINEMIEKNNQDASEAFDRTESPKNEINITDMINASSKVQPDTAEPLKPQQDSTPPQPIKPHTETMQSTQPYSSTAQPAPPYAGTAPRSATAGDEDVSKGIKVGLILLSIFVPIAGIIFGAIYLGKPNPKYKSFGKTILIISIIFTVLSLICCMGMSVLIAVSSYY